MKSSQEIAEEMAEAVAQYRWKMAPVLTTESVLKSIPLAQLIEVARAAESLAGSFDAIDVLQFRNSYKGKAAAGIANGELIRIIDSLDALKATGKAEWL